MATVIRASGVQFKNANLPSLSPVVSDGLVAMFRPSSAPNGLIDLHNKDNQLTIVGNPELLEVGVKTNLNNYLQTDVSETSNLTLIAVAKKSGKNSAFVVGNFSGQTGSGGSSIWLNDDGNEGHTVRAQSTSYATTQNNRVFSNIGQYVDDQYMFVALVVDAENNTMQAYNPTLLNNHLNYSNAEINGLKNRRLDNKIRIGSAAGGVRWLGEAIIAEVIIYDRALNKDDIMTQYIYSKDYFKKKHNIHI